jgi:hypothetical protein
MSILDHAEWPLLRWCLFLEFYTRDQRIRGRSRHRIEVRRDLPDEMAAYLLTLRSPCVACGLSMAPIRKRDGGGLYFAATCAEGLHGHCSKGRAAAEEYRLVRATLLSWPTGSEPPPRLALLPLEKSSS